MYSNRNKKDSCVMCHKEKELWHGGQVKPLAGLCIDCLEELSKSSKAKERVIDVWGDRAKMVNSGFFLYQPRFRHFHAVGISEESVLKGLAYFIKLEDERKAKIRAKELAERRAKARNVEQLKLF